MTYMLTKVTLDVLLARWLALDYCRVPLRIANRLRIYAGCSGRVYMGNLRNHMERLETFLVGPGVATNRMLERRVLPEKQHIGLA